VAIVATLATHLRTPTVSTLVEKTEALPLLGLVYVLSSVPFAIGGVTLCLALPQLPRQAGRIYAADLAGAGVGCAAVVPLLKIVDAPTGVIVAGCVAGMGAFLLALAARGRRALAATVVVALGALAALNA